MHKQTIKAFSGIGEKKVFVGERTVDMPDDLDEAVKSGLVNPDKIYKGWHKSEVIAIQASIRAGTNGTGKRQLTELERMFAGLSPEEQARVLSQRSEHPTNVEVDEKSE